MYNLIDPFMAVPDENKNSYSLFSVTLPRGTIRICSLSSWTAHTRFNYLVVVPSSLNSWRRPQIGYLGFRYLEVEFPTFPILSCPQRISLRGGMTTPFSKRTTSLWTNQIGMLEITKLMSPKAVVR